MSVPTHFNREESSDADTMEPECEGGVSVSVRIRSGESVRRAKDLVLVIGAVRGVIETED